MGCRSSERHISLPRSDGPTPTSIGAVNGMPWDIFITRERAAEVLGMSVGGLALAMQRGEMNGLFIRWGRTVRFFRPALQLLALGLADPAALARFCAELGVEDLPSMLAFILGPDGARVSTPTKRVGQTANARTTHGSQTV